MKLKTLLSVLLLCVAIVIPGVLFAQVVLPPDVNDVPIDGGVSLLVAAGVGYGVKKYRDAKKGASQHDKG